ncbi:DEAD/DEAH box helicase [Segetibacter sp.]|jgi:SNF2 family DNA or RNA helicase|uniref:DEAD/DEAH box helicase n=1 Tax=Segetibacter sp. TaxID=2231182 RepID=UPI002603BFCC|nr:DEAD/DEAH box helicase [Segetibacter sp.]MCW3082194.1 box helicase-like protein [Segetibacter sp.]
MALPHLIKHIYNNGTDEVIRRGKKIHAIGNVELMDYDDLMAAVTFRVKDDIYSTYYKVLINKFKEAPTLSLRCSCPYNLGEICRHESAALFQLQELLDRNMLDEKDLLYDQKHTVVKMKQLDLKMIRLLTSPQSYTEAEEYLRNNKANIIEAKDERVKAEVEKDKEKYKVLIQKNEERNFDTSCNCDSDDKHPLCIHKTIVLVQLLSRYGVSYFDSIRNWDKEKNKLLEAYGFSLNDNLKGKFEFAYKDGKPFLRVLDSSIKRIAPPTIALQKRPEYAPVADIEVEEETAKPAPMQLGLVFIETSEQYPFVQVEGVQGEPNEERNAFANKSEKLDLNKFINTEVFSDDDKMLVQQLRKFQPSEITRYLNRNSPFSGIWENIVQQHNDELPEETRRLIVEFLQPRFKKLFTDASPHFSFLLPQRKAFTTANLQKIHLSEDPAILNFNITYHKDYYDVQCFVKLNHIEVPLTESEISSPLLFLHNETLFLYERPNDVLLVEKFLPLGKVRIEEKDWSQKLQDMVLPLAKDYNVQFNNVKREDIKDLKPEVKLMLKEKGDYLMFQPLFVYKGYEVKPSDKEKIIIPQQDKLLVIQRNMEDEKALVSKIESLHSQFIRPDESDNLVLKGAEVLKNNWFFLFIDAMKELEIPVFGFEALKNFRFNTSKPSTKIYISSHTDWFDAKVEIFFGEQKITVADVKKALGNKQQFVQLQDGSLGILPEEWIKKYSLLFRIGEGKSEKMKLSRYHFSVIEELYENRDEEELFFQLEERYDKLKEFKNIEPIEAPQHLKSILRPYQESGFQWLNYLHEVKWGGILADDMGLGKTIQALSFIQHIKESKGALKALVVCPTTLMYNWENEIKKFTHSLTYYIHHGGIRDKSRVAKPEVDIIITTYGTLRSDIKSFVEPDFDYIILDESQAIKNPSSKVTKAASLLKAKSRLCLSGTPLQNNTFDIFAQMNFLNPGMLGTMEFFKQEFAVPIDKFGEQEQKEHLRRLLFPFILRRTKEQVAKDLPDKTEMILFCEMGDEQRKIYEAFRNDFRDKILGVVENQGIGKSQLTILQGLMKLRQICDSPAIMKDDEPFPNVSIKLDELVREITENISDHKALIFSQFLGMLALIRQRLEEMGIKYEYFDGSTTAIDREKAIQGFQNDETCRVFLISLKAGGVGLNLTAADYVYIVDPWWNPAVEQQAIDRTHRIGQTKNIFAYRMICKDTVEDKILKLQEKKKALAADLITDDAGFVKNLTREDLEYLFS